MAGLWLLAGSLVGGGGAGTVGKSLRIVAKSARSAASEHFAMRAILWCASPLLSEMERHFMRYQEANGLCQEGREFRSEPCARGRNSGTAAMMNP